MIKVFSGEKQLEKKDLKLTLEVKLILHLKPHFKIIYDVYITHIYCKFTFTSLLTNIANSLQKEPLPYTSTFSENEFNDVVSVLSP